MTREEFLSKIWQYYIMLENNFFSTFQYIEPSNDNETTYSKEYCKLFLSVGSEIDVICKELCKIIENKTSEEVSKYNIVNYKNVISSYNNFLNEKCTYIIDGEILEPWNEWNTQDSPTWWKEYNSLKHDRLLNDNLKLANYGNIKKSLSALYILCRILYANQFPGEPNLKSKLFQMHNWNIYVEVGNGLVNIIKPNGSIALKKIY